MNRSALSSEYFDVVKTTIRRLRSSPLAEAAFRAIWLLGFIFIAQTQHAEGNWLLRGRQNRTN
jgi:hypothetical protein